MRLFLPLILGFCVFCSLVSAQMPAWKKALSPEGDGWKSAKQHFAFNNGSEPETLDPHLMTGVSEGRLGEALFEGLVTLDPKTLEARPGVAQRWRMSADAKVYVFELNQVAKWSDGQAVVAQDFVDAWKRVLTAKTGASYAYMFDVIAGAQAYRKDNGLGFDTVGVKALGAHTLEVKLANPCPYILDLMAFNTFAPVRVDVIEKHGVKWTQPENLVGNGPFRLSAWEPRQRLVLVPNEHYWDRDFVKLKQVTVYPFDDLVTAYREFNEGKLDWLPGVPQSKIDEVMRHPDYVVAPYFGTYFYRFNVTKAPFDKKVVRQAFSHATDRDEITKHITKAGQKSVTSLCPPVAGYTPVEGRGFDVAKARKLLAEAGYPGGKGFPPFDILYNTSEGHKAIAEALAQQWKQHLGVTVSARNMEWKVYLEEMKQLRFQVCRSSWIGDYGDPSTFFDMFTSGSGNNRTGFANAEYDALQKQAQSETDPAKRLAIFAKMESILVVDEMPILPLYRYISQSLVKESVLGFHSNIRDIHPLKYLWIEEF